MSDSSLYIIKEILYRKLSPIRGARGLGGDRHNQRNDIQKNGRQKRTPATYTEEASKRVITKVKNMKNDGKVSGKTDTGQKPDMIDIKPEHQNLRQNT